MFQRIIRDDFYFQEILGIKINGFAIGVSDKIFQSIFEANMGVTPQNDGETVRIIIPPLTEERRKDLVKQAKHLGEESKVGLRNARREAMEIFKKAIKDGLPEDFGKRKEEETQKMVNGYVEKIDAIVSAKEKEIMTV